MDSDVGYTHIVELQGFRI